VRGLSARLAAVGAGIVLAGLAAAGAAPASPSAAATSLPWSGLAVGVNDDTGKFDTLRDWFYSSLGDEGLTVNTISLTWDDANPTAITGQTQVANAIAAAQTYGVTVSLDLYPLHSTAFTDGKPCQPTKDPTGCGDTAKLVQFASWVSQVAAAFPNVHQFVVMNECNQPLFVNPQWDASGQNQSAVVCGRALAAAYDSLKGANAGNFVWGVGLSPRGNDNATAATNSSTSPVRFLGYLGAWFRAFAAKTHRTAPLMDGFDFHPYPVPQSLPFATGYSDPRDASVSNLPRIYQAFYDGFNGTPQRTIGQQSGGGLPVSLNETGVQTATEGTANVGTEVSATPAGGVIGKWATESYQSSWYVQMLDLVACDPNVRLVNIFHLLDDVDLAAWQSGLFYADRTPKDSAVAVRQWLAYGTGCRGTTTSWRPGAPAPVSTPAPSPSPVKPAKPAKPGKPAKPAKAAKPTKPAKPAKHTAGRH
jgi:hypothetical protein